MSLGAIVHCNCYRNGRASEPPIPPDLITIDETGDLVCHTENELDEEARRASLASPGV